MIRRIVERIDEQSNLPTRGQPLELVSHPDLTDWEKEVLLNNVNLSGDEMEWVHDDLPTGQMRWQIWARDNISPYDFYNALRGVKRANYPGAAEKMGLGQSDDEDEGEEWKA